MFRRYDHSPILILAILLVLTGCATRTHAPEVDLLRALTDSPAQTPVAGIQSDLPQSDAGVNLSAGAKPAAGSNERFAGRLDGFSKSGAEERVGDAVMVAKLHTIDTGNAAGGKIARTFTNIYFTLDDWDLTLEGKTVLMENAEYLKRNPNSKVVIQGHCDDRGSGEYNLVLGEKRALQTRRYLSALGVKNKVETTSYGKERPVCTEHSEACYWKNRRAEIIVEEAK